MYDSIKIMKNINYNNYNKSKYVQTYFYLLKKNGVDGFKNIEIDLSLLLKIIIKTKFRSKNFSKFLIFITYLRNSFFKYKNSFTEILINKKYRKYIFSKLKF